MRQVNAPMPGSPRFQFLCSSLQLHVYRLLVNQSEPARAKEEVHGEPLGVGSWERRRYMVSLWGRGSRERRRCTVSFWGRGSWERRYTVSLWGRGSWERRRCTVSLWGRGSWERRRCTVSLWGRGSWAGSGMSSNL